MKRWECWIGNRDVASRPTVVVAQTRSKARYRYYLDARDFRPDVRIHDIHVTASHAPDRSMDAERQAREWNGLHAPGTPVVLTNDHGEEVRTNTRSSAWTLGASSHAPGHTAVVLVLGIAGGYMLDRIRPLTEDTP